MFTTEITSRELVAAVLRGEKPDIIPCWGECPMDVTALKGVLPTYTGNWVKDAIMRAEWFDNACVGGNGIDLSRETLSQDENHHCYQYETGAVWREEYNPTFCREATVFPINTPKDVRDFVMPDPRAPGRFDEAEAGARVKQLHDSGYFVEASVMGAWYGIYYYLTSFENILMWMAIEPDAAHRLFEMTSQFSLESAKRIVRTGVDSIITASDMGSGRGLLFSRDMMREYVFPWLKKLADICHENNVYLHLHSHGHIQDIMDDIVEAGVDIINPVGPSDYNDLAMFKEHWGDRITLHGGISTRIRDMNDREMREHVSSVLAIGRKGGRFFPRTESGIPPMEPERVRAYVNILQEERYVGYA